MKEHKGAMLAIKIVAAVFLLTPLVVMFIYSLADRWISILPEGFTVSYYISILTNPAFLMGIVRGIIISAIPVIITNISVLLALYVVMVYLPDMEKVVQIFSPPPSTASSSPPRSFPCMPGRERSWPTGSSCWPASTAYSLCR